MKPISALILAVLAGSATALVQNASPLQALADAQSGRPGPQNTVDGPGWRQMMITRGAAVSVDEALANLTKNLDLTPDQVAKIRPILQAHHDRIRNVLETGPAVMTHDQFMAQVHAISAQTHDQINALLTPHQLELVKQLGTPARI
jgi:hypothetical protein